MHCVRLLFTARDIAMMHKVVVDRSNERDFLLNIKQGGWKYDDILEYSENLVEEVKRLFATSDLCEDDYSTLEVDNYVIDFIKYVEKREANPLVRLARRLLKR